MRGWDAPSTSFTAMDLQLASANVLVTGASARAGWLASPRSGWITGQTVSVNGGYSMV